MRNWLSRHINQLNRQNNLRGQATVQCYLHRFSHSALLGLVFLIYLSSHTLSFSAAQHSPQHSIEEATPPSEHHVLGFSLGQSALFGEWSKTYSDNMSYGIYYEYEASPVFSFMLNLGTASYNGGVDDSLSIKSIEPDLKVNFVYFDHLAIYGFGGFGFYSIKQKVNIASGSTFNFGMNLGFGTELKISDHFVFGPAIQLRSIFSKIDKEAKNSSNPSGLNIGGETMRLYLQMGYVF